MTALQCGRKTPLAFHGIGAMHGQALTAAGHEVEQREIELGEDLTKWDFILFGQCATMSISAKRCYRVMDAMLRARPSGVPYAWFIDDWRVKEITNNLRTIRNLPDRLWRMGISRPASRFDAEWGRDNVDHLMRLVDGMLDHPWPTTILPTFGFGTDLAGSPLDNLATPASSLVKVDITPMAKQYEDREEYPWSPPAERERVWINAALSSDVDWLRKFRLGEGGWPVVSTAKRTKDGTANLSDSPTWPRMPEDELVKRYGSVWGIISRPYSQHIGSGYWRYRFIHAAAMGNIMMCDPREVGAAMPYQYRAPQIETFTTEQLEALARSQADWFWSQSWSRDRYIEALDKVVQG